ncbi:MAG: hypothetical protein LUH18_02715 [Oscillospiraceae bacterium]|nr:hypothetical protein [Oscillospiraceae bacterium]
MITISTTVKLDLNGYSVTPSTNYTDTNMIAVASGGNLTISDSGEDGNITATNRAILVYNGGTLNVTDGTVHGDSIGIYSNGGTVTVSGGTVSCYATSSNGTYTSYSAIYCDTTSGGSLSITDGEVSGYRGIINWGSTVTISGGTVSANSAACAIQQTGGSLTISDGTVTNTGTGQAVYISQGAEATISGGSITAPYEGYGVGVLIQKGTLTMTGGTVYGHNFGIGTNGTDSSSYYPNTITISGGEVSGTFGMYLPAVESTTTISGSAKITGTSTGIEIRAGSLIVNDGEISSTSTTFSTKTNGNGATTYGAGISISQHSTDKDVSVTINGGTISGYYSVYELNTYASKNSSNVTLTIPSTSTAVIKSTDTNDEDEVEGQAVYSASVSEGTYANTTISISGGSYSSQVDPAYCAEGYAPVTTTDESGYYTVTEAVVKGYDKDSEYVAGYATLADALADESEDVVKLVLVDSDIVSTDATASKTLTIDLGGKNLTIESGATLTVASGATVTIVDTAETGGLVTNNGTIAVEGTLDIRDLGYTTDSYSGSGLLGHENGKITLGASSTFIVPDVWATEWSSLGAWTPNWASATSSSGIISSASQGAKIFSFGKGWKCTNEFASTSYVSGTTYWELSGTYLVEYFKTIRGGNIDVDDPETWTYPTSDDGSMIFAGWYSDSTYGAVYTATSGEATAKFVILSGDSTNAGIINFLGGSLRMDYTNEDGGYNYTQTSLRFGYDIFIPDGATDYSWSWVYTHGGSSTYSLTVKGENFSSNIAEYTSNSVTTNASTNGFRSNMVVNGISSKYYSRTRYSQLTVTYVTADGTTVTATEAKQERTVIQVAEAIMEDYKDNTTSTQYVYAEGVKSAASNS